MPNSAHHLPATLLSAETAAFLLGGSLHAMEIQKFDKMAAADQDSYVGTLIEGAEKVLIAQGKNDLAVKVDQLFATTLAGDKMSVGLTAFEVNLARVRVVDAKTHEKNPDARRLEVEHAMILTLKDNGVVLPPGFMTVGKDFRPKVPPQKK
jgi:hypothetical protein